MTSNKTCMGCKHLYKFTDDIGKEFYSCTSHNFYNQEAFQKLKFKCHSFKQAYCHDCKWWNECEETSNHHATLLGYCNARRYLIENDPVTITLMHGDNKACYLYEHQAPMPDAKDIEILETVEQPDKRAIEIQQVGDGFGMATIQPKPKPFNVSIGSGTLSIGGDTVGYLTDMSMTTTSSDTYFCVDVASNDSTHAVTWYNTEYDKLYYEEFCDTPLVDKKKQPHYTRLDGRRNKKGKFKPLRKIK